MNQWAVSSEHIDHRITDQCEENGSYCTHMLGLWRNFASIILQMWVRLCVRVPTAGWIKVKNRIKIYFLIAHIPAAATSDCVLCILHMCSWPLAVVHVKCTLNKHCCISMINMRVPTAVRLQTHTQTFCNSIFECIRLFILILAPALAPSSISFTKVVQRTHSHFYKYKRSDTHILLNCDLL